MGIQQRRERDKAELRQRIMDAARSLFVTEGVEATSMRRIAEAVEYSPASIYVHFRDKSDLLMALCRSDFGDLSARMRQLMNRPDPIDRLRQMGLAYLRFAVEHPCQYRLMFMTPSFNPPPNLPLPPDKGDPETDGYTMVKLAVADAVSAGRLRPAFRDPELATQTFWAGMHGVASLEIAKSADPWIDWRSLQSRARAMVAALIDGMTVPASTASPKRRRLARPRQAVHA